MTYEIWKKRSFSSAQLQPALLENRDLFNVINSTGGGV